MPKQFEFSDPKNVQSLAGNRAVADITQNIPHPEDGMAEAWISNHAEFFRDGKDVHFAFTDKSHRKLIGAISLMNITERHRAELGYWTGKTFWNFGYCTEAARVVLRYAFEELMLNRVHASHIARNPASDRVMAKIA